MSNKFENYFDSDRLIEGFHCGEFAPLLFRYDEAGVIRYANNSAHKLIGDRLEGKLIGDIIANFDPQKIKQGYEGRLTIELPDMNVLGVQASLDCRDSMFELMCFVDVRELLMLEKRLFSTNQEISNLSRELFRQKAELEKLNKIKDEFVSILSHDLRGPLRRVHSFAELLEVTLASQLSPEQIEYINYIKKESKVMHQMVLDILNFEAIQSGKFKLNIGKVNVNDVVGEIYEGAKSYASGEDIEIVFTKCEEDIVIDADYVKIRQVIDNLLTNCIKYSGSGCKVEVDVESKADGVGIEIRDNGKGFSDEELRTLFEPFRKGLAAGSKSESFGFGMAIVKKIVESHSGQLKVGNCQTGGAQFVITLPLTLTGRNE